MGKNQPGHKLGNGGGFGCGFFEELPAHRGVVKQLLHREGGALRAGGVLNAQNVAALVAHQHAHLLAPGAGLAGELAHRRNGGQSLAPETQGAHAVQILGGADFASGVAGEGQANVAGLDAAAVVRHPERGQSPFLDVHGDGRSARVHAVFHQFLDGGGGPFHHFPGCDLADDFGGELTNVSDFHE